MTSISRPHRRPGQVFEDVVSKMDPRDQAFFIQEIRVKWREIGNFELLRGLQDREKMKSEPVKRGP